VIPTVEQVFGAGAVALAQGESVSSPGLFIPFSVFEQNGFFSGDVTNGQELFARVMLKAGEYLNESNRLANPQDVRLTINYADFDAIVDPPGSSNAVRRDVWSVIAYQNVSLGQFNVDAL
jgi:hypothetical protein